MKPGSLPSAPSSAPPLPETSRERAPNLLQLLQALDSDDDESPKKLKFSRVFKNPPRRKEGALSSGRIGGRWQEEISASLGGTIELKRASMDSNQGEQEFYRLARGGAVGFRGGKKRMDTGVGIGTHTVTVYNTLERGLYPSREQWFGFPLADPAMDSANISLWELCEQAGGVIRRTRLRKNIDRSYMQKNTIELKLLPSGIQPGGIWSFFFFFEIISLYIYQNR